MATNFNDLLSNKDLIIDILDKMDDKTLLSVCKTNKKLNNICKDHRAEWMWKNKVLRKFGDGKLLDKKETESWREYFLKLICEDGLENYVRLTLATSKYTQDPNILAQEWYVLSEYDKDRFLPIYKRFYLFSEPPKYSTPEEELYYIFQKSPKSCERDRAIDFKSLDSETLKRFKDAATQDITHMIRQIRKKLRTFNHKISHYERKELGRRY